MANWPFSKLFHAHIILFSKTTNYKKNKRTPARTYICKNLRAHSKLSTVPAGQRGNTSSGVYWQNARPQEDGRMAGYRIPHNAGFGCRRVDEPTSVRKFRVAPRASYAPLDRLPGLFRASCSGWPKTQFWSTMGSFCMIGIFLLPSTWSRACVP
jgi:hypothetical protein